MLLDSQDAQVHTLGMKVTVSIPDDLIQAIDAQSKRLGLSRSAFVTQIARLHVKGLTDAERTAQIDRFLEHTPMTPDPAVTAAARLTFQRNEW